MRPSKKEEIKNALLRVANDKLQVSELWRKLHVDSILITALEKFLQDCIDSIKNAPNGLSDGVADIYADTLVTLRKKYKPLIQAVNYINRIGYHDGILNKEIFMSLNASVEDLETEYKIHIPSLSADIYCTNKRVLEIVINTDNIINIKA